MEVALSAVTSELVSRFISFLMNKYYQSRSYPEEKQMEMIQHLLARVHTVVEEADGRYITNSGMLMQLKMLSQAMYQGYRVLDAMRYQSLENSGIDEVSDSSRPNLPFASPFKRSRRISCRNDKNMHDELHGAFESLEIAVANMAEFVVILGRCERMSRRPYDAYLYIDNFMFGRHTEKQKLLSFLLQYDPPGNALAVLPIIGGTSLGKKSLVAHVCGDERVRLRFSSVLHLNGDTLLRILEYEKAMLGMMLVVVEFVSDVDDEEWKKFHLFLTRMGRGSKVIIISKLERFARFGSVKPIFLNTLPYEELRYFFKTLAFGSADTIEHPKLVQIADEFAKFLHVSGSLMITNSIAYVLRTNMNVQSWLCILDKTRSMIEKNISMYGLHPNILVEQGHPVDISDYGLHPLRMIRYTANISMKKESPKVTLAELLTDPSVIPKVEFNLLWESRIPPYTSFVNCVQVMPKCIPFSGKKRRGVPI